MKEKQLIDKIRDYSFIIADRIEWLEKMRDITVKKEKKHIQHEEKKKIAIVYDVDGWAFNNIAKEIKKNLSEYYEIDIFPKSVFNDNIIRLMLLAKEYDLVHVLWRGLFSELDSAFSDMYIRSLGFSKEDFINRFVLPINLTTSVYDHSFLNEDAFWITESFLKYVKSYTVSSKKLQVIYNNLDIEKKPMMEITDGVDLQKFIPRNIERFSKADRTISIGWVGNSKFEDSKKDKDLKGVRKIIIPAIEELIEEGYNIKKKFADRNEGYIPHDKMPEYYQSIDLYICASKEEGTPNPVLESMACGVPVISTNVGIVPEVLGEKQKKYIIKERSKEALKEKIIQFINNKEEWSELSNENLEQIKDWSWNKKCEQFKEFFDFNLGGNHESK